MVPGSGKRENGGVSSGIPREGSEDSSGKDLPRIRGKSGGFRDGIRDPENRVFTILFTEIPCEVDI